MDEGEIILVVIGFTIVLLGTAAFTVWCGSVGACHYWEDWDVEEVFGTKAEQEEVEDFGCLTSLDLNRDDLRDVVILSNSCKQFGLTSKLYLQQDEQGNQFGIPVCSIEVDS